MSVTKTIQQPVGPQGKDGLSVCSLDEIELETIRRYGITCTFLPRYQYGPYHYTRLEDAVAQAKRDKFDCDN